jgi:pyridoxine kinase
VDPVLGDNGKLDPTQTGEMVESMRWLAGRAGCVTPNLTEAALLLNEPMPAAAFDQENHVIDEKQAKDWLVRIAKMGPEYTVITSVPLAGRKKNGSAVIAYNSREDRFWKVDCEYIPAFYPGTGDTFTSVLTSCLLMGDSLPMAMDRAAQFVGLAIKTTFGHSIPPREGIMLEKALASLRTPVFCSGYEIF